MRRPLREPLKTVLGAWHFFIKPLSLNLSLKRALTEFVGTPSPGRAGARVAAPPGSPSPGVQASHAAAARELPASLRRVSKNAGRWPRRAATPSPRQVGGQPRVTNHVRRCASGRAGAQGRPYRCCSTPTRCRSPSGLRVPLASPPPYVHAHLDSWTSPGAS